MLPTLTFLTALLCAGPIQANNTSPPGVGTRVPRFVLKDTHRRPRALEGFGDKKAFVVVFVGNECPLANLYLPTLIQMHIDYAGRGVQFLAVNSNVQDSFVQVAAHAQEHGVPFPVLKDFDQQVAEAFGAKRTPEVFLLDGQRVIRYHGRIDDQYAIGFQREKPTRRDLKEALDQFLAGKPITTAQTDSPGCLIGRVRKRNDLGELTYTRQVSRIIQKRCQECHRPGEIGPFSLLSYQHARAWADTIREVVLEQRMPPWHADPRFGKFANDRRLTQEETDVLLAWIERGCPRGDEKDMPPPMQFVTGWKIGTPDRVIDMPTDFNVPVTGILDYQRFTVDPGFKEDVWVQAAECRPGNRAVVHHILVYIQERGKLIYAPDGTAATLAGWAPGDMPAIFPPGMAKRVPAGAKLVFEVHYTPNGTEQTDRSRVGILFAKKKPRFPVETNVLANMLLRIPPRAPEVKGQMTFTFEKDALILSLMPHMHLRGTSARYVVRYPDGKTKTLLYVPDYDFNWQSIYRFAEPLTVPRGTELTWIGWWDNSADNPRNPDPSKEVRWGLQTFDEMQNGWMEIAWIPSKKAPE